MKIGNLEVYGIIYKIENLVNGKVYIGQTIQEKGFNGRYSAKGDDIEKVYNYYNRYKRNNQNYNKHLYNSIEKYGFNNFKVNKIFDIAFSKEELDIKEKLWISIYDSTNDNYGYNIENGGKNSEVSEITKEKIRQKAIGRVVSEETKKRISVVTKGENNPRYGVHLSEETKLKISKNGKGKHYGYKPPNNSRKILGKSVVCLNTGEIFECVIDGKTKYNCSGISQCCKNKKTYAGILNGEKLAWRYYEDYIILSQEEINNIIKIADKENKKRKVICLNNKKIFDSVKEASIYYKIHTWSIISCCQSKANYGGTDKITGEKLVWEYLR